MDAIKNILTRESVRTYSNKKIDKNDLDIIKKCATSGPSCLNKKDYKFIIIEDLNEIKKLKELVGPSARPLETATLAIVVCMDYSRAYEVAKDYSIIDATLASQNIMLAANALNIGTCMLGLYPQMDRVNNVSKHYNLNNDIVPLCIISLGYKMEETMGKDHYEEDRFVYFK